MKFLIIFCLFIALDSFAVPVLNRNVGENGSTITIWPDHKDPNQFYYAPTQMNIALDKDNKPQLSLIDYNVGRCRWGRSCQKKVLLTTFFESTYKQTDLDATRKTILASNPKAKLVPIPFVTSEVIFGSTLTPFIDGHNCSPIGGQAADLLPCTIVLNSNGIQRLLPALADGKILVFNFSYKIFGAIESAEKVFKDFEANYSIAVNLGGEGLAHLPDLRDFQ
jgi:hypothetical protein